MKYTQKSFTVHGGTSQTYRDNWERTFRERCGAGQHPDGGGPKCSLETGHEGSHYAELAPGTSVSRPRVTVSWSRVT